MAVWTEREMSYSIIPYCRRKKESFILPFLMLSGRSVGEELCWLGQATVALALKYPCHPQ